MGIRSAVAPLVERQTRDRRISSSRLTRVIALFPCAGHVIRCLIKVKPRKTGNHPNMTTFVDSDVKHQHKQTKQMNAYQSTG